VRVWMDEAQESNTQQLRLPVPNDHHDLIIEELGYTSVPWKKRDWATWQ